MLREAGAEHGFGVTVVEPVRGADAAVYSSTHIRELLRDGKPREAAAQLGRYWEIDGRVMVGDRRGRTIGFPTVNLGLGEYLRPAFGVYAVRVAGRRRRRPVRRAARSTASPISGCARRSARPSRGSKPSVRHRRRSLRPAPAGRRWSISSGRSSKFAGLDALKAQIAEDAARARAILAAVPVGV